MFKTAKQKFEFNVLFSVVNLALIIIFYKTTIVATILLLVAALIALWVWKSQTTLVVFALGIVMGSFAEGIAINLGAWNYVYTDIFNIPIWILVTWGSICAVTYQFALSLKEM